MMPARFRAPFAEGLAILKETLGAADWARTRPRITPAGEPAPRWARMLAATFTLVIAAFALLLTVGVARGGTIWPGEMTLLTARTFGVFLLALALSLAPLVFSRSMAPVVSEMRPGIVMAVLIALAAIVFIGDFNFAAQPLGIVYIGGCVAAIASAAALLAFDRTHRLQTQTHASRSA